ncbi:GtrA family protein [Salmonella enterica subsp. enterica serovar Soerenga]|uniref:GtrA family protein n=1 Tax=Salmonella enterica TaxID=28901 RepID=UPI000E3D9239|nr:GtrA family protein [Salmonella enterica]EAN4737478.1 GtrA family protein [Salmonella enterica subsp. enterica serovar Soerenga]EBR8741235.1 GtrA family protein [Salmonella enterica subsp. enterica serovar Godesberg]EBV2357517.1 GtrA family protein [Salmonella enterica subsp. enterica serovar Ago]EBX8837485.1 GtrA family protein [Salmonella enterica subsp. enterica serovar Urbana]EDY0316928.1 GtrA family protein [Salmonella enterica subsp. enterica]EGZ3899385.1 GtrA family protein [Salmone
MLKLFAKYTSIGVMNTLIHWGVFALFVSIFYAPQSIANLSGFCVAVTFSFFMNARYTFRTVASKHRYFLFIAFMGALAFITGVVADMLEIKAIATLVFFSGASLVLGFLYSKFVVFKD